MRIVNQIYKIILPTVLAGLLGCARDDEFTTHVSGKVVNRFTQEPIPDVYVLLKDGIGASGVIIIDSETASDKRSETYTDANGAFSLELTGSFYPALGASKVGYEFDPDWTDGVGEGFKSYALGGGSHENQVLEMETQAGFNPIFESTVPVNPTDSLIILFQDTRRDLPANQIKRRLNSGWNTLYVGQQASRFISADTPEELNKPVAPTTGDTYTPYQIAYTRNGQWETKIDSVYIKSFETFTDTIYY